MGSFDTVARSAEAELLPSALIIHDRDDIVVPHAHGARLAGAWPGAKLVSTHHLGHHRILRDPTVVDLAVGFITEQAGAYLSA